MFRQTTKKLFIILTLIIFSFPCINCKNQINRLQNSKTYTIKKGLYKFESNLREIYLNIHNDSVTIEQFLKTVDGTNSDKKHLTGNFPYTVKDSFLIIKTDTSFANSLYNSAYLYKKQLIKENKIRGNNYVAIDGNCNYQVKRMRLDTFQIFHSRKKKLNILGLKKSKAVVVLFRYIKNKRDKSNILGDIYMEFCPKKEQMR